MLSLFLHSKMQWVSLPITSVISTKLQLYWNHTSTWVFSCMFDAYFQDSERLLLKFSDANWLMPPSRVQSSSTFTLKFPLFITIVPRYRHSLQISRGFWGWNDAFVLGIVFFQTTILFDFLLLTVIFQYACKLSQQLCRSALVLVIKSSTESRLFGFKISLIAGDRNVHQIFYRYHLWTD